MSCLWPTDSQQRRKNPKVHNNAAANYGQRKRESHGVGCITGGVMMYL